MGFISWKTISLNMFPPSHESVCTQINANTDTHTHTHTNALLLSLPMNDIDSSKIIHFHRDFNREDVIQRVHFKLVWHKYMRTGTIHANKLTYRDQFLIMINNKTKNNINIFIQSITSYFVHRTSQIQWRKVQRKNVKF